MATHDDFNFTSRSDGGPQYFESAWSSFMNTYNIGGTEPGSNNNRTYSWSIRFNNYGKQIFDTAVDDSGDVFLNGTFQFSMGGYNGQSSRTTPGFITPGVYTISATSNNTGSGPYGVALDWTGFVPPAGPSIQTFQANPNPQTSPTNGTPSYSTTLSWNITNSDNAPWSAGYQGTITSSAGESWTLSSFSGSLNITNLPQSVVGTNSPATRSYTLTTSLSTRSGSTVSEVITVSAYNDNTPNNFTVPSTTTIGTSLNSLEASTQYIVYVGQITGIDMSTAVVCNTSGLQASTNQSNWSNAIYITNNQGLYLRFTSQPFNTDPSGLTNPRTYSFSVGTLSKTFTATTRAPDVNETFDFGDNATVAYPYPDIDIISNTPTQYIESPTTLTVDDIEIPVEIKVDQPNAEIRIKAFGNSTFGSWTNVREKFP